jgi:hypothetical protein
MKQRRAARRLQPMGVEGLTTIRQIVAEHQAAKVNEVLIDAFTASCIVHIFDALNEKNREKMLNMPVAQAGAVCLKLSRAELSAVALARQGGAA